jgi:uncharacterized membrane-anchored protein
MYLRQVRFSILRLPILLQIWIFSGVYSITLFPLMYFSHRALLIYRGKPTNVKHWNERLIMISLFTALYSFMTFVVPLGFVHNGVLISILLMIVLIVYTEKKSALRSGQSIYYRDRHHDIYSYGVF